VGPRGPRSVEVKGSLSGDSFQFIIEAVASGHGIGLVPEQCLNHRAAADTALTAVLPQYGAVGAVQSLVHPSRHLPKRVTLLREHLTQELLSACDAASRH
jgi:DNA-binding transcriptional LysR family regulator